MNEWIARARAAWDNLSLRERALLSVCAGAFLIVVLWLAVINPLSSSTDAASVGVETAERQLELMKRLRREYDEVAARLSAVEQRIRAKGRNQNLLTLLESLASTSGVKVESMEERQAANNETYRETKVEVSLRSVNLTQAITYLHNIEASPQLLSVKSLRVKKRPDDSRLLDVTFAVSSFEPL